MNARGRFAELFSSLKRIKIPSALVDGKLTEPFYIDVDSVDDECIRGSGRVIEYHFVDQDTDLTDILESAAERSVTTLLVHMQFILDGSSDDELMYIATDGAYTVEVEEWTGERQRKLVEIYSLAQAGKYPQYDKYRSE